MRANKLLVIVGAALTAGTLVGCYPAMVRQLPEVAGVLMLDGVPVGERMFSCQTQPEHAMLRGPTTSQMSKDFSKCRLYANWNCTRLLRLEIASSAGASALITTDGITGPH